MKLQLIISLDVPDNSRLGRQGNFIATPENIQAASKEALSDLFAQITTDRTQPITIVNVVFLESRKPV